MPTDPTCPRITVVTPSFNQAPFLPETIESVLGQNYPNLEYIVLDGGSTDGSPEIIKRYEKHLAYWCSAPDGGQAAAINAGFARATGDILGWLNSDDYYLPGALNFAALSLDITRPELLFGNCFHFVDGADKAMGSQVPEKHRRLNLELIDYLVQPSTFWTRKLWDATGPVDATLNYTFDWDWFIRAKKSGATFIPTSRYLSAYRLHAQHKSATGGDKRFQEIRSIYARYQPERIVQIADLCRGEYARLSKIRRRSTRYGIGRWFGEERVVQWFHPALKDATPEEIRDILDMIAP